MAGLWLSSLARNQARRDGTPIAAKQGRPPGGNELTDRNLSNDQADEKSGIACGVEGSERLHFAAFFFFAERFEVLDDRFGDSGRS